MKGVIISTALLIAALVFVIWSGAVADSSLAVLIEKTEALPDEPTGEVPDMLDKIEGQWEKHKELYSAIIKFDFVYNFSKEINAARAGAEADDPGTYLAAKKAIINVLEYLRDVQRLRLDNII